MGRKIITAMGGDVRGKTVGLLGLTFKPNTDDMRDAPSLAIVQALLDAGATVRAFDPEGMDVARTMMPNIVYCDGPYAVAEGASAIAIVTEWNEFRALDLARLTGLMVEKRIVDLRNLYDVDDMAKLGIEYECIGRPASR
jgi:UDPglucose 6-dehydrogenase